MREVTVRLYHFDELGEREKERARDWYREASAGDTFHLENVIEDAETVAGLLGITFKHYDGPAAIDYDLYRGWASFEGSYRYNPGSVARVKEYAPEDAELHRIAQGLQEVQRPAFYRLTATVSGDHERGGDIEVERTDGAPAGREAAMEVAELLRDFMRWIYERLLEEDEYQSSDEQVDETIRANEYEFTEDGRRARA